MKVYTLPIIDEDGEITGKPGAVIVSPRELEYRQVDDLRELKIGEAGPLSAGPDFAKTMDTLFLDGLWNGVKRYQKVFVRNREDDFTVFAFYAWERMG
jgi:hypothetical protein